MLAPGVVAPTRAVGADDEARAFVTALGTLAAAVPDPSPNTATVVELAEAYPGVDLILDGGYGGLVPSTVLDVTGNDVVVVREGAGPVDTL